MVLLSFVLAALLGTGLGAALVWAAISRRAPGTAEPEPPPADIPAADIPFTASIDQLATSIDGALASASELRLLGIYAGREDGDALEAIWRAPHLDPGYLPRTAPVTLHVQLERSRLIDADELERGLRLALAAASAEDEARVDAEQQTSETLASAAALRENPFELDDQAFHRPAAGVHLGSTAGAFPDEQSIAARIVAAPWHGPFGWQGVVVAQPMGADRARDLARLDSSLHTMGDRLGVHCEISARRVEPPAVTEQPAAAEPPQASAPPPPAELPLAQARLQRATARIADALMSPRRVRDVIRATVNLLAEGLATDRCYAIEVDGLHPLAVEHEKRSEAATSAVGIDLGDEFLGTIRSRFGQTITALTLDANSGALVMPESAAARLGSVSRMLIPILEKGRIVVVFVAEWIDLAKKWSPDDVSFAEKVVARAATARKRMLQFDALAEQAGHARLEQEQMADALSQLQALVAALPEAVVGLDVDGNVTFANPAAARLLGRMEFELMGRSIGSAAALLEVTESDVWERVLGASRTEFFEAACVRDGLTIDVTVIPGVAAGVFNRLISLRGGSRANTSGNGSLGAP